MSASKLAIILSILFLQACATSVHEAARTGDKILVASYLDKGGDVNAPDEDSWYCNGDILTAMTQGRNVRLDLIELLLTHGADVNSENDCGNTPLSNAVLGVRFGSDLDGAKPKQVMALLIEAGADPNYVSKSTGINSAILRANMYQCFSCIEILAKHGADMNAVDQHGNTVLHFRVQVADERFTKVLLAAGADPTIKNHKGQDTIAMYNLVREQLGINSWDKLSNDGMGRSYQVLLKAKQEREMLASAERLQTVAAYQRYLQKYPHGMFSEKAQQTLTEIIKAERIQSQQLKVKQEAKLAKIKARQPCRLKNDEWLYTQGSCSDGFAHGRGEAVTLKGLTFIGEFQSGQRTAGEIYFKDELIFDGFLRNGKPHGKAICMHEGEPESCEYYRGKRVDSVFIQRREFEKQRTLLENQQRKIEERLTANEVKMDTMAKNIKVRGSYNTNRSNGKGVGDVLLDKAADKAVDAIFDQLF